MVATAIIGSAIIGGVSTAIGASSAAKAQTNAANRASDTELRMFDATQKNIQPFVNVGKDSLNALTAAIPGLAAPINMDQATLEATPGYKWNLAQTLKAAYNSASARGLGASGAAIRGAETAASGLADNTYQQQFGNALANKTMMLKALGFPVELGANAAAGLGTTSAGVASNVGSNMIGAGNAQAASNIAMGNSVANTGTNVANALWAKQMGLF